MPQHLVCGSGVVALLFRLICSKRNLSFVYYGTERVVSGVSVFEFESVYSRQDQRVEVRPGMCSRTSSFSFLICNGDSTSTYHTESVRMQ